MSKKNHSRQSYHTVEDDVEPAVKRQKNERSLDDEEHTNIDSALLDAGDDEHARHEELMNRVKTGILEAVVEPDSPTRDQVNNSENSKNNGDNEDHDVMLHKVVSTYSDDETLKRVAEADTASMAVRAVSNSDKGSDEQRDEDDDEQQDEDEQQQDEDDEDDDDDGQTHNYNDLINRHEMDTQNDTVQVELNEANSLEDMNDRRLLAKRGRKTTAIAGSEAWKQQRKDSHKEVERRRRENINMAINSLSGLLPVKESSKAAILSRAAEYIQKLKETENANIEKWTLQKLLSEQTASQLSRTNEKLQVELANAFKEIDFLKNLLKKNNIQYESDDDNMQN